MAMPGSAQRQPSRVLNFLMSDRMCPWATEAQSSRSFFRGCLGRSFYDCSEWVAELASKFTVGVIYAPKLITRLGR